MRHLLLPLLAAAIFAGACATYPRTPEELERQARARAEAVERGEAGQADRRGNILYRMAQRWEGLRACPGFRKENLIVLKAICLYAMYDWGTESQSALLGRMHEFADVDAMIYFHQERLEGREARVAVAQTILDIGEDLRDLAAHGALSLVVVQRLWANVEAMATMSLAELDAWDETEGMLP